MASSLRTPTSRGGRRARSIRPALLPLEPRTVPSLAFPGIAGITFDSSGNVLVSYNSTTYSSGQQQAVAEVDSNGYLVSANVFGTTGATAFPGALATVGPADSLPSLDADEILELQPNGQLFVFNAPSAPPSQYDDLADNTLSASNVYDVQTGQSIDLSGTISLAGATYGDFGIHEDSLVVSAESNNWDFVMRVTYDGTSGGAATVLAASPASDGLVASPGGVAVDSKGTVLASMPFVPSGSTTAIHVAVGFGIFYDTGDGLAPTVPTLGLTTVPNIASAGIAVDSQDNFLLAASDSSLYGGGQGIVHINSALTAFLADPTTNSAAIPTEIAYGSFDGSDHLAFTDTASDTYTIAGELSLFSGQVTPAMLRHAYGIDQIAFTGAGGTLVAGDGTGQTIAIIEEGVAPTLEADLTTFDQFFGIPAPPSFTIVNQYGVTTTNFSIVGEASLDVEWAHAVAPGASIVVYNAAYLPNDPKTSFVNLIEAMQQASELPGVTVVSLSYGVPETQLAAWGLSAHSLDANFTTPGVTFVVAAGDSGIYGDVLNPRQVVADYPAASPNVVAVGGTSITIDPDGDYPGTGPSGEVAWGYGTQSGSLGGGGGGLSTIESQPTWQRHVVPSALDPNGVRALPDVSIDAGSVQPYDVFTSTLSGSTVSAAAVGWLGDAGTSAAAPIWAGLIAIANQGRALAGETPLSGTGQTLPALYSLPSADFHDIVSGNNGDPAGPGYDLATGLGTPIANLLIPDLAWYGLPSAMAIQSGPPPSVAAGESFGLTIVVQDKFGNPASGGVVAVALGSNPGGAVLGGTLTESVVDGVATFTDLTLSQPGTGYTLMVSVSSIAGAETTSSINVTPGRLATQLLITPPTGQPVFGQSVILSATATAATGVPTGTVTFTLGSTNLGSATLVDGVAELATARLPAGTDTITAAYSGDSNDQPSSVNFVVTVSQAVATLDLHDATVTFDGLPHGVGVHTSPPGLSGVAITYTINRVVIANPTRAGTYTITATLANANYTAQPVSATLVIGQAAPTITWAAPADITAGTPLGPAQLDAVASFGGSSLAGGFAYAPPGGTVLPTGDGQTLTVTFTPKNGTDFRAVTYSVPINVVPRSTPTPTPTPLAAIIGESPVFRHKLNKRGKPVRKAVLAGFTLEFNTAIGALGALNPGNYRLDVVTTRRAKRKVARALQPISDFVVTYATESHSVTLDLVFAQSFPKGGLITVLPGVTEGSGAVLGGATVFRIAPRGKSIRPA